MNSAIKLAIFNHKGGVGKSTLTVNIAAAMASLGKRVLLVDSDPQCNLSAYLIEESVVDNLLDQSDSDGGQTMWSAVKPVSEAQGGAKIINAIETAGGLKILPGDVRLIEFEEDLATFWGECYQRKVRGFKGISSLSKLIDSVCLKEDIDFVFYDSGPNIGSLNRVIILDCDYIIVPVACDLFSLRAVRTLGKTLSDWVREWKMISAIAPEGIEMLRGRPKLLGYIPQRFRIYRGAPSAEYAKAFPQIEKRVQSDIVSLLKAEDKDLVPFSISQLKLGEIKDFGTLAAASQTEGVPIWESEKGTDAQRLDAKEAFLEVARAIIARAK